MRVLSLSFLALVAASPALAKDYMVQAPATEVVVHPDGARVTYLTKVEVEAGTHRIMVAAPRGIFGEDTRFEVTGTALTRGPMAFERDAFVDLDALLTSDQASAKDDLESAKNDMTAANDALEAARGTIAALEAKAAYLLALGQPDEASAETLIAIAGALGTELAATNAELVAAKTRLAPLKKAKEDADFAYEAASIAYSKVVPFHEGTSVDVVSVEVTQANAGPVVMEIEGRTGNAGWAMTYDFALSTQDKEVAVDRKVLIGQYTGMPWRDVDLSLSTSKLFTSLSPSEVYPDQARLMNLTLQRSSAPKLTMEARDSGALFDEAPAPVAETATAPTAMLNTSGPVVTYDYPKAVSAAHDEQVLLDLDQVTLTAKPMIHAAPRYDDMAYMVAEITNTSGAPLLPGAANVSRDGHYMGATHIGRIPAGATETVGFGPVEGIQLDTIFVRNQTGDTGLIAKSATRDQIIRLTVENLTNETQAVTAFFPITYSEEEDLRVKVNATPAPNAKDVEDKRGVSSWDLALAPGEKTEIRLEVSLGWPEGSALDWNP